MEAFSLLKYWRANATAATCIAAGGNSGLATPRSSAGTTTIVTGVTPDANGATEVDVNDDDGPFFDLEFAVPHNEDGGECEIKLDHDNVNGEADGEAADEEEEFAESDDIESTESDEGEGDFKLCLSSNEDSLSPSDDLFFKGTLVPIEQCEHDLKPQVPVSLLKSALKFRVFMLGLKKSKSEVVAKTGSNRSVSPKQEQKFFALKFKVEEVPIVSLFTRDTSKSASSNKLLKQISEDSAVAEEKLFSKEVVQKYLKKVKPLYIRVSKRYGEKLRFSGHANLNSGVKNNPQQPSSPVSKTASEQNATATEAPENKQGNIPAGMGVVRKHLGKSRSASSSVVAAGAPADGPASSRRRDDSLLQQQDGIQSAILHCKRSFNTRRDSDISRCVSDSLKEKSADGI